MTREDVEENYEFRVVKRILKKEFPFIKDIRLTDTWDNYKSLFFVDVTIDTKELFQYLGLEEEHKQSQSWSRLFTHGAPYLILLFSPDIRKDKVKEKKIDDLSKKIANTIQRVQKSPSLPPDMKLPRNIALSDWIPMSI